MAGTTSATTDHEEIRKWVEERGGHPATVKGTGDEEDAGLIRIDFPGYSGANLEPISWEEWFKQFDDKQLALLHEHENDVHENRFFKLVSRDSVEEKAGSGRS